MWAVVGLGNPGRRYSDTRHNVGFLFIRELAKEWKVRLRKKKFLSKAVVVKMKEEEVLLAMPQTYMNKSGLAVKSMIEGSPLRPEHLIVIYDDLDIPLGEIRVRKEGGAGSHKGMISIIKEIQTTQFPRIRVGIGPLGLDEDAVHYVLSSFRKEERHHLEQSLEKTREALDLILAGETEKAINVYNQRVKKGTGTFFCEDCPQIDK